MELYLQERQTRASAPTPYQSKLAGAIEEVFGSGVETLDGLVAGLNSMDIPGPAGAEWTEESFTDEIARLGA